MQVPLVVRRQENIIRRDIPVDNPLFVDALQGLQHGHHQVQGLLLGKAALFRQIFLQRPAVQKLHGDIGRSVGLEAVIHMDDAADVAHLGQALALLQKAVQALLILGQLLFTVQQHDLLLIRHAGGKLAGQIFLDGNAALEHGVPRDIGNSKAAVAHHPADHIAPHKQGAGLDMPGGLDGGVLLIAAEGTNVEFRVIKLHAAHALGLATAGNKVLLLHR